MDEQNLRASLRDALEHGDPPPSMPADGALAAGRRAARRRTLAAGAAAVGTLAVLTAAGVVATSGAGPAPALPVGDGGKPTAAPPVPGGSETKPVWPTGPDGSPQGDRTAKAGVKADAADALLAHVLSLVPAGYTAPNDPGGGQAIPSRNTQAQFEDKVGGRDAWSYLSTVEIRKDGRAGQIIVSVYEPGLRNTGANSPCDLSFWSRPAGCEVVKVGGKDVAVATGGQEDSRIDKWSAYIYPDGTVVFVALSSHGNFAPDNTSDPLVQLPFDDQKLAALALDPAFHIAA